MEEKSKVSNRNYGIDLLRVVCMLFILILHSLGHGGVLKNTVSGAYQYKYVWFLEIIAYVAVDIFALISGYVSYSDKEKKYNFSNYINIWLEVVFYNIIICFIYNYINPELVTRKDFIMSLLPVTNKLYWYLTAYTGLFLLMPVINKAIRNTSELSLKKLLLVLIIGFSFFDRITNVFGQSNGYSVIWIVILYIIGAIIKKCHIGENLKWYHIIPTILGLYIISLLYKLFGFSGDILKVKITKDLLINYTSPTILGASILYLIGFSKLKLNNFMIKLTKFMAPAAFSVYVINDQKFVWSQIMQNRFANIISLHPLAI